MALKVGELFAELDLRDDSFTRGLRGLHGQVAATTHGLFVPLLKGAVAAGAGVAAALIGVTGAALVKGFKRLTAIEDATAKLTGLGHSAAVVKVIMDNALGSVLGTAYGLDEAATIAAGSVAAGVEPGKQLRSTLGLVADAATIAKTSLTEMGAIFNKVATSNKIQGDVINQLNDAGIPIVQMLAKVLGKTAEEVVIMASKGEIGFAKFSEAMQEGLGGAALKSGNTTTGAFKNMGAAMSRFGASMLTGVFPLIKLGFGEITKIFDDLGETVGPVFAGLGKDLAGWVKAHKKEIASFSAAVADALGGLAQRGGEAIGDLARLVKAHWGDITGFLATVGGAIRKSVTLIGSTIGSLVKVLKSYKPTILSFFGAVGDAAKIAYATVSPLVKAMGKLLDLIADANERPKPTGGPRLKTGVEGMEGPYVSVGEVTAVRRLQSLTHDKEFAKYFKDLAAILPTLRIEPGQIMSIEGAERALKNLGLTRNDVKELRAEGVFSKQQADDVLATIDDLHSGVTNRLDRLNKEAAGTAGKTGKSYVDKLTDGLTGKGGKVKSAAALLGGNLPKGVQSGAGSGAPLGSKFATLVAGGLTLSSGKVKTAGKNVGAAGRSGASAGFGSGASIGLTFGSSVAAGILQALALAAANALTLALGIRETVKAALEIGSPSRVGIDIGHTFSASVAQGVRDGASVAVKDAAAMATEMAMAVVTAMRKALHGLTGKGAKRVKRAAELTGPIGELLGFVNDTRDSLLAIAGGDILPDLTAPAKAAVRVVVQQATQLAATIAAELNKAFPHVKTKAKKKDGKTVPGKWVQGGKGRRLGWASEIAGPAGEVVSFALDMIDGLRELALGVPTLTDEALANVRKLAASVAQMASGIAAELVKAFPKATMTNTGTKKKPKWTRTGGEARDALLDAAGLAGPAGEVIGLVMDTMDTLQAMTEVDPRLFAPPAGAWQKVATIIRDMVASITGALSGITISDAVLAAADRVKLLAEALMSVLDVMKGISEVNAGEVEGSWAKLVRAAGGMVNAAAQLPSVIGVQAAGAGAASISVTIPVQNLYATNPEQARKAGREVGRAAALEAVEVFYRAHRDTWHRGGRGG